MANIQIRNVPEDLHQRLRDRARLRGMSLSSYLRNELLDWAAKPSIDEWLDEVSESPPIGDGPPAAELVREGRREAGRE